MQVSQTSVDDSGQTHESFGVLIGCSGHSPVPLHLVDKVAAALHQHAIVPHRLKVVWGGGDPCFRFRDRGGNVADIARALQRIHATFYDTATTKDLDRDLTIAAVQREDHAGKVPAFEKIVVSYHASLAEVGGRVTFGGYETEASPAYHSFLRALRREVAADSDKPEPNPKGLDAEKEERKKRRIQGAFLPPDGIFPMAASAGYLSLLPALLGARELVLMVVPTAGMITLQEVTYTKLLIEHLAKERDPRNGKIPPVHIYVPTWDNMEAAEANGKCKLSAIIATLRGLQARFPENVHFFDVL